MNCCAWFGEVLFPVIGTIQMFTAVIFTIFYGELMYYHGVLILPCLLLISGLAGSFTGFTVNYERFIKVQQSRKLMICTTFVTISCAIICYFYLLLFVSNQVRLANMQLYFENPCVKRMIDLTQQLLQCCGDSGFTDWFKVDWQGTDIEPWKAYPPDGVLSRSAVPFSCCSVSAPSPCTNNYMNLDDGQRLYRQGCRCVLENRLKVCTLIEGTVLLLTGFLQIVWLLNRDGSDEEKADEDDEYDDENNYSGTDVAVESVSIDVREPMKSIMEPRDYYAPSTRTTAASYGQSTRRSDLLTSRSLSPASVSTTPEMKTKRKAIARHKRR